MALTTKPLVSIITPIHNGAEYLEELIQSVLRQDYSDIEHLIIDDGSQDDEATLAILRRYPHLRWWSRENRGQYATMNEGLLAANGEYVCFVSADDVVSQGAVSAVMDFLGERPHYDGVFGITTRIDLRGESFPYYIPFRTAAMTFYPYFAHISHCSLYLKKASLQKHGLYFDPSLKYVGDYEWMIRIHKCHLKIGLLQQELSKVRIHDDQASRKYARGSILEAQQVISAHRINKLTYGFFSTLYRLMVALWSLSQAFKRDGLAVMVRRRIRKFQSR